MLEVLRRSFKKAVLKVGKEKIHKIIKYNDIVYTKQVIQTNKKES